MLLALYKEERGGLADRALRAISYIYIYIHKVILRQLVKPLTAVTDYYPPILTFLQFILLHVLISVRQSWT